MTDRTHLLAVTPLPNPLDPYTSFIERLVAQLDAGNPVVGRAIEDWILTAIRRVAEANVVAIFKQERHVWVKQAQSLAETEDEETTLLSTLLEQITGHREFGRDYHGLVYRYESAQGTKAAIALPVFPRQQGLMVIGGLPEDSLLFSEVCGRVLTSLYQAAQTLTPVQVPLIEAAILDDLKRTYGFVPLLLYNRRFQLFCNRLAQMVVYFEPVLRLDPDYLYIDSWEALARNPENDSAPIDLFEAAELWGDRFMIELDAYFVREAVKSYRDACQLAVSGRRREDIREISVNVYPQSLIRRPYFEAVSQVIHDKLIQPEKLILEISEKFPLWHPEAASAETSMEAFRRELSRYVRDLKIGFSIDDFGVGHASVSRLTGLSPAHVKIDRNILHQERTLCEITLRFVLDLASSKHLRAPKVVVEGFDSRSPITLRQLYQLGIRYVQGYVIGKAGPELSRLNKDRYDYLKQLINEDEMIL